MPQKFDTGILMRLKHRFSLLSFATLAQLSMRKIRACCQSMYFVLTRSGTSSCSIKQKKIKNKTKKKTVVM